MGGQYIEPMYFGGLFDTSRWPSVCAVCHGWGTHRVCAECVGRFVPTSVYRCRSCALEVPPGVAVCGNCLRQPPPFERTVAAVDYAYPWDTLIVRFKFNAAMDLAGALATRLLAAVRHDGVPLPSLLLPMPLSPQRLRERGYNQSWELARRAGSELHCVADPQLLLRIRDSPHQLSLPWEQRAANVRGVFAVEPVRSVELRGRTVALIDDVMTTGATASEAASTLLQAGASSVQVWVVGRTPRPEDR